MKYIRSQGWTFIWFPTHEFYDWLVIIYDFQLNLEDFTYDFLNSREYK